MGMFAAKPADYYTDQTAPRLPLNLGMAQEMVQPQPMGTHPIGMDQQMVNLPTDPRVTKATQPGMFGKGGRGWQILGIIGDALQTAGGGKPTYQEAQQKWAEMQGEQQKALLRFHLDRLAEATKPTDFQRNADYLNSAHPGLGDTYLKQVAEGPPVATDVAAPDGSVSRQFLPRSAIDGGSLSPPPGAISLLKSNPSLAAHFDAKYGPGSAARVLGGASPTGSPTFPR